MFKVIPLKVSQILFDGDPKSTGQLEMSTGLSIHIPLVKVHVLNFHFLSCNSSSAHSYFRITCTYTHLHTHTHMHTHRDTYTHSPPIGSSPLALLNLRLLGTLSVSSLNPFTSCSSAAAHFHSNTLPSLPRLRRRCLCFWSSSNGTQHT